MYCNNCGAQNPVESAFCSKCGNRLAQVQVANRLAQTTTAPTPRTNGMAITALVLSIISFLPLLAICSIPAIILGVIALNQIKKEPAVTGKGMALAGLICGSITMVLWLCLIILGIVALVTESSVTSDLWVSVFTFSALI
jgi:hypothetical protein